MNSDFTPNPREELEARLTALLLGELSAEEAAALQQEIKQDAKLAELHGLLKSTVGMVREVAASPTAHSALQPAPLRLSEDRRQRLLAQFKTVTPREFARPKRREAPWVLAMSIAAVLVALVGAVALFPAYSGSKRRSMVAFKSASDRDVVSESESLKSAFTIVAPQDSKAEGLEIPRSHTNSFVVMTLTNGIRGATNSFGRGEKVERFMRGKSQADNLAHIAPPPKPAAIALPEGGEVADGKKMALAGNFYLDSLRGMQAWTNGITDEAGVSRRGMERKQGLADQTLGYKATELPALFAPAIVPPAPQKRLAIVLPDGDGTDDGRKLAHTEAPFFGLATNYQVAQEDNTSGGGSRSATSSQPSTINNWAYSTSGGGGVAGPAPKPSVALNVGDPEEIGMLDHPGAKPSGGEKGVAQKDFPGLASNDLGGTRDLYYAAENGGVNSGRDSGRGDANHSGNNTVVRWGDSNDGSKLASEKNPPADRAAALGEQQRGWALEVPKDFQTAATNGVSGTYFGSINGMASSTYRSSVPEIDPNTGLPTTASVTPDADLKENGANADKVPMLGELPVVGSLFRSEGKAVDSREQSIVEPAQLVAGRPVPQQHSGGGAGGGSGLGNQPNAGKPEQGVENEQLARLADSEPRLSAGFITPPGESSVNRNKEIPEGRTDETVVQENPAFRRRKPAIAATESSTTDGDRLAFGYKEDEKRFADLKDVNRNGSWNPNEGSVNKNDAGQKGFYSLGIVGYVNVDEARKQEVRRSLQTRIALPSAGTVDSDLDLGAAAHEETLKKELDRSKNSDSNASVEKLYALQDAVPAEAKEGLGRKVITEHTVKQLKEEDRPVVKPVTPAAEPQAEVLTGENAFSTFSLNVADVSFRLAGASLEKGVMPEPGSVRSEEFINAFDYRDPAPAPGAPIGFAWERVRYPFAQNRDLLRFSVKTAAAGREAGRPLNIVLLLDNSGSMERADRVQIIHEALKVLASQLQPQDKLSVVTFARTPRLWMDGVAGNEAGTVAERLSNLAPQGGTNLEDAMKLAYETALRHYLANGVNRVVLLTDGAANLGNVDPAALKQKVEAERKQGIALDCFGIGWEGYNDDLLEVLSRNGDGRYGFINTPEEATTGFASQLAGALYVAAADVKVQVEFNPQRVTAYRQIGYAKHQLTKEQFRDNTVDAAELGAAESGNALYAIEVNPGGTGPLATVHVRYKEPGTGEFHEHEWAVPYNGDAVSLEQATPAMRLATSASAFSEWLASSPYAADVTPDRLLGYLGGVPEIYGADTRPKKLEWMVRQAKSLSGK
ncbi:MAG: von Willebrand factor type [Pedosphaera sp.]|nr:von Willebrand factor type [Pedosphaera sp.]